MIAMDSRIMLSLFHIIFVAPLLLGIGFIRSATPEWLYMAILILGVGILLYHGYKLLLRIKINSNYSWVNALHILTVAPLLIYIGIKKRDTPRFAYELLVMLGFSVTGYHLYSLVSQLQAHPEPKI